MKLRLGTIFFVILVSALSAAAQDKKTECTLPNPGKTFFALSVADVEKSASWYRDTFGFRLAKTGGTPDGKSRMRLIECNGVQIELADHVDAVPRSIAAPKITRTYLLHGYFKSGIFVEDIDVVLEVMKQKGVPVYGSVFADEEMGVRTFLVKDHDGNVVQFFSKLKRPEVESAPASEKK